MSKSKHVVSTGIFKNTHMQVTWKAGEDPRQVIEALNEWSHIIKEKPWKETAAGMARWVLDNKKLFEESSARRREAERESHNILTNLKMIESTDDQQTRERLVYQIGLLHQTLAVRLSEEPAKVGRESLAGFRGKWIKVPPLHRLILEYVSDRESVSMTELVRDVWDEKYQPIDNRYKQAIFKLNKSLRTKDKSLPQFSIEGDNLVVVK